MSLMQKFGLLTRTRLLTCKTQSSTNLSDPGARMRTKTLLAGLFCLGMIGIAAAADVNVKLVVSDKEVGTMYLDNMNGNPLPAILFMSTKDTSSAYEPSTTFDNQQVRVLVLDTVMAASISNSAITSDTDVSTLTNTDLANAVKVGYDALKTTYKDKVDATKLAVIGWGIGANAIMAAINAGQEIQVGVAGTPDMSKLPMFTMDSMMVPTCKVLVMPGYDSIDKLAGLETSLNALGAAFMYEIFMQYGTSIHFGIPANANYKAAQAARAQYQWQSFMTAAWSDKFAKIGTVDISANSPFTNEEISYKDGDTDISGYIVRDKSKNQQHGVVVVPAWKGFDNYAIARLHYLAGEGYAAISANIYNQPMGYGIEDMGLRIGNLSQWRVAEDESKAKAFAARITAAKTYLTSQSYTMGVSVVGFCFGGTGVYNTYRFGEDFSIQASMHGNMMKTRDFASVTGSPFKGYLAMFTGVSDQGESGDVLVAHLADISKLNSKWELHRYSAVGHGFSEWSSGAYNPWAEGRSFDAFLRLMTRRDAVIAGSGAASLASSLAVSAFASVAALFFMYR